MIINRSILSVIIVIIFLCLFYGIGNYLYLEQTADFPSFLESNPYRELINWIEAIKAANFRALKYFLLDYNIYEPLYYVPSIVSSLVFNVGFKTHVMLNIVYFILFLIAIYLLAKEMYDTHTAFIVLALASVYPGIYTMSRCFLIEFGLLWVEVFTVYLLIKSDYFYKIKYSFFVGIVMAFGLMMKASYALFIFPLVFYFCVIAFKKADSLRRKYVFQNILLIFFILFIITGYRYCRIDVLRFYIFLFVCEPTNLSIGQCINILYSYLLSPIFFILFIASFFWILFYEEQMKKMIFLVWFLPAFLYHSFMLHHREIHYIVPLLPVIALMSARVLNMIRWNYIKSIVISMLFVYGIVCYYNISFKYTLPFTKYCRLYNRSDTYSFEYPYHIPKKNPCDAIIEKFSISNFNDKKNFSLLLLPCFYDECPGFVNYFYIWKAINWLRKLPFGIWPVRYPWNYLPQIFEDLNKVDCILYLGKEDLKAKENFFSYINLLVENDIDNIGIIKDDDNKRMQLHEIHKWKLKLHTSFSSFSLFRVVKMDNLDGDIRLYIYKKKEKLEVV